MGRCAIIEVTKQLFFRTPIKERRFYYEARIKIRRKEAREHLEQLNLACELANLIRHFFPDLLPLLKQIPDPRSQKPELYYLSCCVTSYDPYPFFSILHQQYEENK